jgi:RNA polymerase sigma factor (TIGR02999 family)
MLGRMSEILIADDHPLYRDALRRALNQAAPGATLYEAATVPDLLALVEAHPDAELLLLDLHMPGARGFSALAHLRGQYPGLPVIVVSAHEEGSVARRALAHGATGYIPKSSSAETIVEAIRQVREGEVWLPPALGAQTTALKDDEARVAARVAELTPQQFRVLAMIAEGLLNKQIAYELGVSEATVKAHMTAIMRKLGCNNRTQVALAASQLALEPNTALPPMDLDEDEITGLLRRAHDGDAQALEQVLAQVYERLRQLARRQLALDRGAQTLCTTALVHEAFVGLIERGQLAFDDRARFFAYAATSMRNALIDRVRRRGTRERHADDVASGDAIDAGPLELAALDQAFARLHAVDPRLARIAELRLAAGLSSPEIGALLGVTDRTVEREWLKARAFLSACLH